MKTILSLTLFLAVMGVKAQNNLVVFSENGEKFFLIINGVKQNLEPETNVKVTDLIQPNYKAKIVFEDKAKGVVDQNIYFMQDAEPVKNYEFVYSVGMKKKGLYKARPVSAVAIGPQTKTENDQTVVHYTTTEPTQSNNNVISDGNSSSTINIADDGTHMNNSGSNNNANVGMNVNVNENNMGMNTGGSITMSGSAGTNANSNGANVSMNVNGANMNINVNENNLGMNSGGNVKADGMTTTSSKTVTTTTKKSSNGTTTIAQSTTVSGTSSGNMSDATSTKTKTRTQTKTTDGYEVGTVVDNSKGCKVGMSSSDFNTAKESINGKSFEDSKLTMSKQILDNNCVTSAQVKEIMGLFSFENNKLDLAKYAYGRTVDKNNYYMVNDAFTFESSIAELDKHIKKATNK